jgi:hypothetical protein
MTRVDSPRAETSPGTPAPARQRTVPAALAVAGACWLLLISFVLPFPHTESGVDGPLAVAWWNDKVTGGLLLVLCAGAAVAARRSAARAATRRP